jgi:16S rRNA U1498 N3-methylase RsmE
VNLLLLEDSDFIAANRVLLSGRRLKHLNEVHRAEAGDSLRVGHLNGLMGSGQLLRMDAEQAELSVQLDQAPPSKLSITACCKPSAAWVYRG